MFASTDLVAAEHSKAVIDHQRCPGPVGFSEKRIVKWLRLAIMDRFDQVKKTRLPSVRVLCNARHSERSRKVLIKSWSLSMPALSLSKCRNARIAASPGHLS